MKTLVTHVNPHLDDACAFWLLRRFHPSFKDAKEAFVPAGTLEFEGKPADSDPDVVMVGVGRGKFDEHTGLVGECSTTLVWAWIQGEGWAPKDPFTKAAVDRLCAYVYKEDTGQMKNEPLEVSDFSIASVLAGANALNQGDSTFTTALCYGVLDALLPELRERAKLDADWEKRVEFGTPWGRGVGVETTAGKVDAYGYSKGFVLVALVNPEKGYRQVRARSDSATDLTHAFEKAKALEPNAPWYLHHSKKLLICGGSVTPGAVRSRLTLAQLMALVKA